MAVKIVVDVNGTSHERQVDPRQLLVHFLRDELGLTGTKIGCETSLCGACTILMDGQAVKSCTQLAVQADGTSVTTIEGLAEDGDLHPLQQAFWNGHGLQCGFCSPGMIMASTALLDADPPPDEAAVRRALKGNLCRCTGYHNITRAVLSVLEGGG